MPAFEVRAHWDAGARVWWAESDDVIGLVAEAETYEALVTDLRAIIPELVALNMPQQRSNSLTFTLISDRVEEVCAA